MSGDGSTAAWLVTVERSQVEASAVQANAAQARTAESVAVEIAADVLWAAGALAIEEPPSGPALIAGFPDELSARGAAQQLDALSQGSPDSQGSFLLTMHVAPAPAADEWHDVWLDHLEPVAIGPFVVHPPWLQPSPSDLQEISIDPGRAFGSGQHPTTALAIELLAAIVKPGDRILDVGTGTGILAIASARLGAVAALGIDFDPAAVACAQANVVANRNEAHVRISDQDLGAIGGRFDVVVANITCHSMLPLVPDLCARSARHLVVSGLLDDQRHLITDAAVAHGLSVQLERALDGWLALAFNYGDVADK